VNALKQFNVGSRAMVHERFLRVKQFLMKDMLLYVFIALALIIRLVFWFYTKRIWEDYMITATGIENALNGFGLTHHVSERVHYFTSPMAVLIPLLFHPIAGGILIMRIASLISTVGTIFIAYRICRFMNFNSTALVFVLSYLSFDFLHIIFGMTGMETQIGVFIVLLAVFLFMQFYSENVAMEIKKKDSLLGICLGLCMLCRPDFVIVCLCIGMWILFTKPSRLPRVVIFALIIYLPWIIFTILYYGSPIPNTILAKSRYGGGPLPPLDPLNVVKMILERWTVWAPIYEYTEITSNNSAIRSVSCLVVIALISLAITGAIGGSKKKKVFHIVTAIFMLFVLYDVAFVHNEYFMWYLPPFTALAAILVGAGINSLSTLFDAKARFVAIPLCIIMISAYILPLPFMLPLVKQSQLEIEEGVLKKVGIRLSELMDDDDTVTLEPLGYIGYYARNKTIYDYPGLGSKIAVESLKRRQQGYYRLGWLIRDLAPDFACLRPNEYEEVRQQIYDFDTVYTLIDIIKSDKYIFSSGPLVSNRSGNSYFLIFQRNVSSIN